MRKSLHIFEKDITHNAFDDKDILSLIEAVRHGIKFAIFSSLASKSPFSLNEWSGYLHVSERTMQRYQREKTTFDVLQSGIIVEITLLYKKGIELFSTKEIFNAWLETPNLSLGNIKPKDLLDTSFGINLLRDELTRIEHGVLA